MNLTISQLADAAGVGVETVRFYQRRGLIDIPDRTDPTGRIRRYGATDVARLRFVRKAQKAGFSLAEIAELLDLDAGHDHARARAMALTRLGALDAQIAELDRARAALRQLADLCGSRAVGPCPILAAFEGQ